MNRLFDDRLATDLRAMVWPLSAMVALWTIVPVLTHQAPPLDVVESAMWGREWIVGSYKHPAMPAWFIEVGRHLNGDRIGWPAYFASQLFNLGTLIVTYLIGRDLVGARVGLAAALSLLGVEYFSWRSIEFNHTIAQMPFWVGSVWCAWRATRQNALGWYVALALVAAFGLYAKLSNATLLAVIGLWFVLTKEGRRSLATPGPWLALAVFAIAAAPVARWLLATDFQALKYASARGREQSLMATLLFPANAFLQGLPIAAVLGIAGLFGRRDANGSAALRDASKRDFLLLMAFGPPALSIVLALAGGSGLRISWLAPAFPLLAILAVAQFEARLNELVLKRIVLIALTIAIGLPLVYAVVVPRVGNFGARSPLRVDWPQKEIAEALSAAWAAETGKPLKIIAGTSWIAGLVGIDHRDKPSILTEGDLSNAPWIKPQRLRREGALAVWIEGRGSTAMPKLDALVAGRETKEVRVPLPRSLKNSPIVIKYAVIKPE